MVFRPTGAELAGLVAAVSADLTGRVHSAYRRSADERWWRRRYPGWPVPKWDYVSLCGRRGLIEAEAWQAVDCGSCRRVLASRKHRLATRVGSDG